MRRDAVRLRPWTRWLLYLASGALFVTGIAWAGLRYLIPETEEWTGPWKADALKIHGAFAMVLLVLVGMLLSTHVRVAWRARRNRSNGVFFLSSLGLLVVTGYGLYYFGDERLRSWTSWIHLGVGALLPVFFILHVWLGRKTRIGDRA
ncbi:MAG TPA: hypothetical protein VGG02_07720 [Chthoniobacterales bacterium]|jgi:cation transport ATPase